MKETPFPLFSGADGYFTELYTLRMLVFIEEEPQSNQYRQIILTKGEFKRLSDLFSLGKVVGGDEKLQFIQLRLSNELHKLPDLKQIHELTHEINGESN